MIDRIKKGIKEIFKAIEALCMLVVGLISLAITVILPLGFIYLLVRFVKWAWYR